MPVLQHRPLNPGQGPTPPSTYQQGRCSTSSAGSATAHQQVDAAEAALAAAVTRARQTGASWTVIGAQLGISRQGAQQRFTRAPARKSPNRLPARTDRHQVDSTTTQTLE